MYEFKWIEWNISKCEKHGIKPEEAEYVVQHAGSPYPKRIDDQKILVWGKSQSDRHLQVIYLIQVDGVLFIIHARQLTRNEKSRFRRKLR